MKNLTVNEISYVSGGLSPLAYIASSSIWGILPGMVIGLAGQTYIIGMVAIKQKPPYTIGSVLDTAFGGFIWTLPVLGVGIAGGATAGAMIGCIRTAAEFVNPTD